MSSVFSVWTKWFSTPSQSGWLTSGRISCRAFWEVSAPCIPSSSCVSFLRLNMKTFTAWTCSSSSFLSPLPRCFSPRSEGSVLAAHRAVQEGRPHHSGSPEGGSFLRHLHCVGCSWTQQQAGSGHPGTPSVEDCAGFSVVLKVEGTPG